MSSVTRPQGSPLARYLLTAYALLLAYATLHPLTGWRDRGASPWTFLSAPLPQHVVAFDTIANVVAYIPMGFLAVLALHPWCRGASAVAMATAFAIAVSACLEAAQSYLPNRVPSNLDLLLNALGSLTGALLGAASIQRVLYNAVLIRLRESWFRPGGRTDIGLVIIALWLLTQLNPETLLFGTGYLRSIVDTLPSTPHPPEMFVRVEAIVSAAHLIALGLFLSALIHSRRPVWLVVLIVVALALGMRSIVFAAFFGTPRMFGWATQGALFGLVIGLVTLAIVGRVRNRRSRIAIAGVVLMVATVMANVAPGNPYRAESLKVWSTGQFLNFYGLTGFISMTWPFIALTYLIGVAIPTRGRVDDHSRRGPNTKA
jgi:VanZ family protein